MDEIIIDKNFRGKVTREYINPETKRRTELIIYHNLQKISICTRDKNTFDYVHRIYDILCQIEKEYKDRKRKQIAHYTIQISHI